MGKMILIGLAVVVVAAGVFLLFNQKKDAVADYKNIAYMINGQAVTFLRPYALVVP